MQTSYDVVLDICATFLVFIIFHEYESAPVYIVANSYFMSKTTFACA